MKGGSWSRRIACVTVVLSSGCSVVLDWDPRVDAMPDPACSFKEPNDTVDAAMPLAAGETGPGAICTPGDRDFYRFTVPADLQDVVVSVSFDLATSQDLDLRIYNPMDANMILTEGLSFFSPEVVTCPGPTPTCPQLAMGDYILEIFGASPSVLNSYMISITITPQT